MPDPLSSFSLFLLLLIFWVVKMFLLPGLKPTGGTSAPRSVGERKILAVVSMLSGDRCLWRLSGRLIIVRIRRYCFVIQEIVCILGCAHALERPRWLVQIEEICQIRRSTVVGKGELTFWNPEVMLDET